MTFLDKGGVKESLGGRPDNALRTVRAKRETEEAGQFHRYACICHAMVDCLMFRQGIS